MLINTVTKELATEAAVRAKYPNSSFPATFPSGFDNWVEVANNAPAPEPQHDVIQGPVECINGVWQYTYSVVPWSQGRINAARRDEIMQELILNDRATIRALREGDAARLAEREAKAQALRAELASL